MKAIVFSGEDGIVKDFDIAFAEVYSFIRATVLL